MNYLYLDACYTCARVRVVWGGVGLGKGRTADITDQLWAKALKNGKEGCPQKTENPLHRTSLL